MSRFLVFFSIVFLSCLSLNGQSATAIEKFDELHSKYLKTNDTTYVVNFWATWCKPCVAELPYFLETEKNLSQDKVKFIFVSLDFADQLEKRVVPFLKNKKIDSTVYLLADQDSNKWIPQVNQEWSGAIPATAVYKNGAQVYFDEKSIESTEELNNIIAKHL